MAMDGGMEDDAPARPTRGPDDAVEQDAVQRRCRGKGIAGASSSGAAGASYMVNRQTSCLLDCHCEMLVIYLVLKC